MLYTYIYIHPTHYTLCIDVWSVQVEGMSIWSQIDILFTRLVTQKPSYTYVLGCVRYLLIMVSVGMRFIIPLHLCVHGIPTSSTTCNIHGTVTMEEMVRCVCAGCVDVYSAVHVHAWPGNGMFQNQCFNDLQIQVDLLSKPWTIFATMTKEVNECSKYNFLCMSNRLNFLAHNRSWWPVDTLTDTVSEHLQAGV